MKKDSYSELYAFIASRLTKQRRHKKLTIAQLSRESGEQYNTIVAIEQGRRFSFHQALWILQVLGLSIDEVVMDFIQVHGDVISYKEKAYVKKESKKESRKKSRSIESFL